MIKTYQFIKKILEILKEQNFSLDSPAQERFLRNLPIYIDSIHKDCNYSNLIEKNNKEDSQLVESLLKQRLLEILEKQFFYYFIYHRESWAAKNHDYIHNSENLLKDRIAYLSKITNIDSVPMSFLKNIPKYKGDTEHKVNITGDMLFDTVDFNPIKLEVGFHANYKGQFKGKSYFSVMHTVESKKHYFKDISLLSLAASQGCDHFIEQLIIKGCNIYYKDVRGKTALDYYKSILPLSHERTLYIKSLLDGSYKNGYYQSLYERQKLGEKINSSQIIKNTNKL